MARVLLVDDDDFSRGAAHALLERMGHTVFSTGAGDEALDHYRAWPSDLVITDLIMPEVDGLEVIQQLRQMNPSVRVVAISGGGRINAHEYLEVARKFGAVGVLSKPFTGQALQRAVEEAMASPSG